MVGYSISLCVRDIAAGKVRIEDVDKIIAGTRCVSEDDWLDLIARYREIYWSAFPDLAENILRRLLNEGKIDQPRVDGAEAPNIANGHWNTCVMCSCYNRPGFIMNAWQIVPCFACNPGNTLQLDVPNEIQTI